MSKFNDEKIKDYTIMKVDTFKPCILCGESTQYIDYVFECRVCSEECENQLTEDIMSTV